MTTITISPEHGVRNATDGDLGPNQLAWLRKNIPQFKLAKKDADRVIAETDRSKAAHPMLEERIQIISPEGLTP